MSRTVLYVLAALALVVRVSLGMTATGETSCECCKSATAHTRSCCAKPSQPTKAVTCPNPGRCGGCAAPVVPDWQAVTQAKARAEQRQASAAATMSAALAALVMEPRGGARVMSPARRANESPPHLGVLRSTRLVL